MKRTTAEQFRITQIIPATGWHAVYWTDDEAEPCEFSPLACWALGVEEDYDIATCRLLDYDPSEAYVRLPRVRGYGVEDGCYINAVECSNFVGYAAPGEECGVGREMWRARCLEARERASKKASA